MKGMSHELMNFVILFFLIPTLFFLNIQGPNITYFSFGWVIGTLYLSPDLDADYSRPLNVHVHRPPAVTLNETPEEFHISTGLR